jgi:uncharacterized protein
MFLPPELRPQIDAESRPYWDALRDRTLLLPYCEHCRQAFFYPRTACPRCHRTDVSWRPSPGRGVVYAVTMVHRAPGKAFAAEAPYAVALLDLPEGCRILMRVHPDDAGLARVGAPGVVDFEVIDEDLTMPLLRIAAADQEETA